MIFHATVLEVLLCVGLGVYIGFVLGLRLGAVWGYEHGVEVARRADPLQA